MFYGELEVSSAFAPVDWHVHEMLYGYLPAIVAGFLLTAIPNWTGRLPIQGTPLLVLFMVWVAGRFAVTFSTQIGWLPAAIVDCGFLALLIAACARARSSPARTGAIFAFSPWSRYCSPATSPSMLEAHMRGHAEYGARIGIAAIMLLIILIGGRIIPSFTRNWLARENPGRLPAPFGRFDAITIAVSAIDFGVLWIALPGGRIRAAALVAAAALNLVRLARWAGDRTVRDRLVADPARCLCLRAVRLPASRPRRDRLCCGERGDPCLDGRGCGHDDSCRDDAAPASATPVTRSSLRRRHRRSTLPSSLPRWRASARHWSRPGMSGRCASRLMPGPRHSSALPWPMGRSC